MEIQGKIVQVLPLQSGVGKQSGKEWKKQEYILESNTDSQFPKQICFSLWGDRIDQFQLTVGELVTVQIDIESREFNGRWYTDIRAYRVDRGAVSLEQTSYNPMAAPATPQATFDPLAGAPTISTPTAPAPAPDDLPF